MSFSTELTITFKCFDNQSIIDMLQSALILFSYTRRQHHRRCGMEIHGTDRFAVLFWREIFRTQLHNQDRGPKSRRLSHEGLSLRIETGRPREGVGTSVLDEGQPAQLSTVAVFDNLSKSIDIVYKMSRETGSVA